MRTNMEILKYFPEEIAKEIRGSLDYAEEIRIRANKNIIIKTGNNEIIGRSIITQEEIMKIMQKVCENSIYAYQNQICNGYITVKGGHRIGVTGNVIVKDDKIINIKYISSLNFRITKQIFGCANKVLRKIINYKENSVYNTLIISAPGAGKTTILKEIVRNLSDGIENEKFKGINVSVIDERGEIAAMHNGVPQNDIGIRTDVLDNIKKSIGIKMAIRSMAPKVIVADEIGNPDDVEAIHYAICSGVKGIFTAHGLDLDDVKLNPEISKLIDMHIFERIIILDSKIKGEIDNIYSWDEHENRYRDILAYEKFLCV